jgi:hypothetical protein
MKRSALKAGSARAKVIFDPAGSISAESEGRGRVDGLHQKARRRRPIVSSSPSRLSTPSVAEGQLAIPTLLIGQELGTMPG